MHTILQYLVDKEQKLAQCVLQCKQICKQIHLYKTGTLARQRTKEFQEERNARDRKLKVGSHPITHKLSFGPLWRGRGLEQ
jgi:hypothetical protein